MRRMSKLVGLIFVGWSLAGLSHAAETGVGVSVSVSKPGIYGRVDVGTHATLPPLIYPKPVIIQQAHVVVNRQPIYMHVPPGHSRNWAKHCHKYQACEQPVYFVQGQDGDHDDHHDARDGDDRKERSGRGEHKRGHGKRHKGGGQGRG